MNERTKIELQDFLVKVKEKQKTTHTKTIKQYMYEFNLQFLSIPDEVILESLKVYEDNPEMYEEKPIQYFYAIVTNKAKDFSKKKARELHNQQGIPNLNLGADENIKDK